MRSRRLSLSLVVALLGAVAFTAGCAGDHPAEPTIGSVDFTPRLVIAVDDAGFEVTRPTTENSAVSADPPSAPEGTVVEIRNAGERYDRVTNGATIDTGILQPGDTTTVVLTTEGDLDLRDTTTGATLTVAVTARQG